MSRRADCYDNAAIESWFGTLKTGSVKNFASMFQAMRFDSIEAFYTSKVNALVSRLGQAPVQFECNAFANRLAI